MERSSLVSLDVFPTGKAAPFTNIGILIPLSNDY